MVGTGKQPATNMVFQNINYSNSHRLVFITCDARGHSQVVNFRKFYLVYIKNHFVKLTVCCGKLEDVSTRLVVLSSQRKEYESVAKLFDFRQSPTLKHSTFAIANIIVWLDNLTFKLSATNDSSCE